MPSVGGNPAQATFLLLRKGKIPKQTCSAEALCSSTFFKNQWSVVDVSSRGPHTVSIKATAARGWALPGKRALRAPSISTEQMGPPHQERLPPGSLPSQLLRTPESRSRALKLGLVTNASQVLFINRSFLSRSQRWDRVTTGQRWKAGVGLMKTSQAMLYLPWARDSTTVLRKLSRFVSTEFWLTHTYKS